ncbi:MAG TPA: hypothetical protein DCL48_14270, partial [Alphaproteobacteria bacterium]|nr:hypothetical protein [Alphaproteobacteria bacterium]
PFIVRERLAVDGHHLPEAFAAFQLGGDHALQEYMKRQLTPLVALAMGSAVQPKGNERGLDRLLEEMFTGPQNGRVEMLREALRITPERWPQALYTWKAALFYEYRVRNFETRFARFLESVQATKIYAYSVAAPVEIVLPLRASLIARAQSAKAGLDRLLMTFSDAYRKDLIGSGSPDAFRDYLLSLHEKLYDFGVVYGILEQIVGYWEYWFISRGLTHVPAEFFMGIGRDLLGVVDPTTIGQSALPSFREPEPAPRPVAAAGAGAAHAVLV